MLDFEPGKACGGYLLVHAQPAFLGEARLPASLRNNANDPDSNSPIAQNRVNSTGDHRESIPTQSSRQ